MPNAISVYHCTTRGRRLTQAVSPPSFTAYVVEYQHPNQSYWFTYVVRHRSTIMSYQEPIATVLSITQSDDAIQIQLKLSILPIPPIAPASLHDFIQPHSLLIEIHKLVRQGENNCTFETYATPQGLPRVGQQYLFRSWWTFEQLSSVKDTSRIWVRELYPDNGGHEHCLLTWEYIAAYADHKEGYHSGRDWITVGAYQTYIENDLLRIRN
jgi:hypothetical protein